MPHVVTRSCCADASCVFACPVNCIHPTPDEPDFGTAEMLFIDPKSCVDCGACVSACPVGAIKPHSRLQPEEMDFLRINSELTDPSRPRRPQAPVPTLVRLPEYRTPLRVAVVGSGPAGLFTADELLRQPGVEATVFDRLPVPHGLARHGVAPDHGTTREVRDLFAFIENQPGFSYRLGVEIGRDITAEQLAADFDAVVYATGASADRSMNIPGEDLPGSTSATDVVAWYNGHPDHAADEFRLDHERVVIVGNGNVALDVARILVTDPDELAGTEIAPAALEALRHSAVQEVVILGRRGPAEGAFTLPELLALARRDDLDLLIEAPDGVEVPEPDASASSTERQARLTLELLAELAERTPRPGRKRIILRFRTAPVAVVGTDRAEGLEIVPTRLRALPDGGVAAEPVPEGTEILEAGLVLRSVGYRGLPLAGLPFDETTSTVPHEAGRVAGLPGTYVTGWIKRGPRGFLGSNKTCARETVNSLLTDAAAGLLTTDHRRRSA